MALFFLKPKTQQQTFLSVLHCCVAFVSHTNNVTGLLALMTPATLRLYSIIVLKLQNQFSRVRTSGKEA